MKRAIFIFSILLSFNVYASVQKGIVRTAGRANHQGKEISDVIIRAEGAQNAVASQADGTFSIRFHDIKEGGVFRLNSVKKANYEVLDKGLIGRSLAFSSSVPMTIVLLDKNEMEKERKEMTSRFEKTYAANYNKRVKEIEEQYSNQVISLEQKIEALEETDNLYEKIQSQINEMVDHYVRTDYDVLDSLDKEINHLIELGEFEKAKEKILSKGNINERVQTILDLQKQVAHNEQSIKKLQQQQAKLANQVNVNQENLLKDLMNLYHIARTDFQLDIAQTHIEQMLTIAPNDLEVLKEAASFECIDKLGYLKALNYSNRHLSLVTPQYPDSSIEVFNSYNRVVYLYSVLGQLDSAQYYAQHTLSILKLYDTINNERMQYAYSSLGDIYRKKNNQDSAIYYYERSLDALKSANISDSTRRMRIAELYYRLSWVYTYDSTTYDKAYMYNSKAIETLNMLNDSGWMIGRMYNQRLSIFLMSDSLDAAMRTCKKMLLLFPSNFVADIASTYSDMAEIFSKQSQYDSALVCINEALKILASRYPPHHISSVSKLMDRADIYYQLGNAEAATQDYETAIEYTETYYQYEADWLFLNYKRKGKFYENIGNNNQALKDYKKALEYCKKTASGAWWHEAHLESLEKKIQTLCNKTEKAENP